MINKEGFGFRPLPKLDWCSPVTHIYSVTMPSGRRWHCIVREIMVMSFVKREDTWAGIVKTTTPTKESTKSLTEKPIDGQSGKRT